MNFLAFLDDMWFLATRPMITVPKILRIIFRVRAQSVYVTNKSSSLTYTVASSFVSTSPLALTTVVGLFRDPYGFQLGRVKVCLADHVHACSGIYQRLSFLGVNVDAAGKIHSSEGE